MREVEQIVLHDKDVVMPPQELEKIVADYKQLVAQDRETLLKLAKAQ